MAADSYRSNHQQTQKAAASPGCPRIQPIRTILKDRLIQAALQIKTTVEPRSGVSCITFHSQPRTTHRIFMNKEKSFDIALFVSKDDAGKINKIINRHRIHLFIYSTRVSTTTIYNETKRHNKTITQSHEVEREAYQCSQSKEKLVR